MKKNRYPSAPTQNCRTVVCNQQLINNIDTQHPMVIIIYYLRYLKLFPVLVTPPYQFDMYEH